MRISATRFSLGSFAKLTLMTAGLLVPFVAGCDDAHKADKRVLKTIEEARLKQGDEATNLLNQAAKEANAAAATKAYAKSMLAQAELDKALADISDPEKGITANSRELSRLIWEIGALGQKIRATNNLAGTYAKFEPKEARALAAARVAEINGAADKPNWGEGATAVPTLAAVQQQVAQLQGQVEKQQGMIQQLQAARQQKAKEAEQAARAAESVTGQQGLTAFKIASGLRKDVADLGNQIEVAQAKLAPVQQDLALAQARQAALTAAVDQFQKQAQQIEAGWSGVQKQTLSQQSLANSILNGGGESKTTESIGDKTKKLTELWKTNDQKQKEVEEQLTNAIQHFDEATTAARELSRDSTAKTGALPRDNPMRKALDTLATVYDPNVFQLSQANAKLALANLQSARAQLVSERLKMLAEVGPAVKEAGLQLPGGLEDTALAGDATKVADAAGTGFDDAGKTFLDVSEAGKIGEAEKNGGRAGRVYALYGRALLGRTTNDPKAAQYLTDAKAARDLILQESKGSLPVLPAELVVAAAALPSTQPTTAPAATEPGAAPAAPAAPATTPTETPATTPAPAPAP